MVDRGQTVRVELQSGEVVEGKVSGRRNTRRRSSSKASERVFHRTHLYFDDGTKLAIGQLHKVTITQEATR
jgi:hypothetical protein